MSASQQTLEITLIMEDSTDPITLGGVAAPVGSFLTAEDGSGMFYKTGATDLDWDELALVSDLSNYLEISNNLSDVANASTARTNLGLAIGSDVQAWDDDLDDISALTPTNDDFMQYKSGAWSNRTIEEVSADLSVVTGTGLYIFMTGGNQSTTSATATAITDLITPTLEANSRYIINAHIHIGCNNTGGVLFAIDIPSGSVFLSYQGRTSSGTAYRAITNNSDATLFSSAFSTFNNSLGFVTVCGEIATGVSGGTAQLMFASGTAGQTSLIYQEGTWVFIKKIA